MKLGPYDLNTIVTGNAKLLAKEIPDNSVDLILTDPEYQNIDDYYWLAQTAARVLGDNRPCLAWYGIGYAPQVHEAMSSFLSYRWRLVTRMVNSKEFHGRLLVCTQECLWYEKGHSVPTQCIFDFDLSSTKGRYKRGKANWGKGQDITLRYVSTFSRPGDTVVDFFTGSGTVPAACKMLARNYLAFEIKPEVAQLARDRVRDTQPPLPLVMPEQLELLP